MGDAPVTSDAVLGYIYALAGRRDEARKILTAVHERSKREYVIPLDLSLIHAASGENDDAFGWLGKAYEERSTLLIGINVAAWYDTCVQTRDSRNWCMILAYDVDNLLEDVNAKPPN